MVTYHDDVIVGVEFLAGATGNISHRNELAVFDLRGIDFPRLAHVEENQSIRRLW